MTDRLLSVDEIADRVGCSVRTVRRWISDGVLPSVKLGGLRRVREAALDRLIGLERTDWGIFAEATGSHQGDLTSISAGGSDE